jgi:hypothetical protein
MALDPTLAGLIIAALLISTILYAALIRRRAGERSYGARGVSNVLQEYGRSALP